MMLMLLSPFTSACTPITGAFATVNPTEKRAICCASMMLMALSAFASPQLPVAATQTSKPRTRIRERMLLLCAFVADVGVTAIAEPPVAVAVKYAVPTVTTPDDAEPEPESEMLPPAAPEVFALSDPNDALVRESKVRRLAFQL